MAEAMLMGVLWASPLSSSLQGHDSLVQNQPGQLQSHRARLHQQISKELRMRTGAENLYR